jgi:nucleoside phosphorylase
MVNGTQASADCRFLLDLLRSEWSDLGRPLWLHERKVLKQLIFDDLMGRIYGLDNDAFNEVCAGLHTDFVSRLTGARLQVVPRPVHVPAFPALIKTSNVANPKHYADAIILTVLPVERDAVLAAFGRRTEEREEHSFEGNRCYRVQLASKRYGGELSIWITMIGKPQNVPAANFIGHLHDEFSFRTVILVGIAGGNRQKVRIGDVVSSTTVLDNDGGVDLPSFGFSIGNRFIGMTHRQPRVRLFDHEGILCNLLNGFSIDEEAWHRSIREVLSRRRTGALTFDSQGSETPAYHHPALIQAGERLKRDGALPGTARDYHDKLYAVEMEGSGFAQACRSRKYEWMVVRGISDYGDPSKRNKNQSFAALSAATALKLFLESEFQKLPTADVAF